MPLSRSAAFTLFGLAMGAGIGLAGPYILSPNLSATLFGSSSNPLGGEQDSTLALETNSDTTLQSPDERRQTKQGRQRGLFQQLDLTPSQKQKLMEVRKQYQGQIRDRHRAMQQAQREWRSLLVGSTSADTVRSKFAEFQQLQQSTAKLRFQSLLAMREVLTPVQRQQLAMLMRQQEQRLRSERKGLMGVP